MAREPFCVGCWQAQTSWSTSSTCRPISIRSPASASCAGMPSISSVGNCCSPQIPRSNPTFARRWASGKGPPSPRRMTSKWYGTRSDNGFRAATLCSVRTDSPFAPCEGERANLDHQQRESAHRRFAHRAHIENSDVTRQYSSLAREGMGPHTFLGVRCR